MTPEAGKLQLSSSSIITATMQSDTQLCVDQSDSPLMDVSPTVERERLCQSQNSNVPAVVVDVSVHKGQVAAVVNNGLHLRHFSITWFVVDGAQQHTPAINKAIPPGMENHFNAIFTNMAS